MLELQGVRAGYGGIDILNGIDLRVAEGELVVVIGPNGAGKSTVLKTVAGLVRSRSGSVRFAGQGITRLRADNIFKLGIGYVPQERNVFPSLSVRENLEMGAVPGAVNIAERYDYVCELFPQLRGLWRKRASSLSGGERQFVAIGRALMREPRLLMLDEPTASLSPKYADVVLERVQHINQERVAVLMVEQNARQALGVADRGYVLNLGRTRLEGSGADLLEDPEVGSLFLGG